MRTFDAGDIVRVPFPYTDRSIRQRRPALVVSDGQVGRDHTLLWVAMITSAAHDPWPGDVRIDQDGGETGLPIPSLVRSEKIATLDARDAEVIGRLAPEPLGLVRSRIMGFLGSTVS